MNKNITRANELVWSSCCQTPDFFLLKMMVKLNEVYSWRTRGSNFKSPKDEAVAFFRVTDSTAITVGILLS